MAMVTVSSCPSLQKPGTENTAQDSGTSASSLPGRLQLTAPQTQTAKADFFFFLLKNPFPAFLSILNGHKQLRYDLCCLLACHLFPLLC